MIGARDVMPVKCLPGTRLKEISPDQSMKYTPTKIAETRPAMCVCVCVRQVVGFLVRRHAPTSRGL